MAKDVVKGVFDSLPRSSGKVGARVEGSWGEPACSTKSDISSVGSVKRVIDAGKAAKDFNDEVRSSLAVSPDKSSCPRCGEKLTGKEIGALFGSLGGKKGGKARAANMTPEELSAHGRKMAEGKKKGVCSTDLNKDEQ